MFFNQSTQAKRLEKIKSAFISSLKPEVVLTQEHHTMIDAIAQTVIDRPELGRQMRAAFIAICNGETHA